MVECHIADVLVKPPGKAVPATDGSMCAQGAACSGWRRCWRTWVRSPGKPCLPLMGACARRVRHAAAGGGAGGHG